jgi:hypothetical protein
MKLTDRGGSLLSEFVIVTHAGDLINAVIDMFYNCLLSTQSLGGVVRGKCCRWEEIDGI